jgi:hypothetical protein
MAAYQGAQMRGTGAGGAEQWAGILEPQETILWQSRPGTRLRWEFRTPLEAFFALFFTGFSVFWTTMVARESRTEAACSGLVFVAVGLWLLVGQHFWGAFRRRRTQYILTNRRALIATDVLGRRKLESHPIRPDTMISLHDGPLGAVHFATRTGMRVNQTYQTIPYGFDMIPDSRAVFAQMRGLQGAR